MPYFEEFKRTKSNFRWILNMSQKGRRVTRGHSRPRFISTQAKKCLQLILSLCFCFPFPCLGKKVNANRNSGVQRKTHSLRLRKQEQGVFLGRGGTLVCRSMCASLFGEKKRDRFVPVNALHTCTWEPVCVFWLVDREVISLRVTGLSQVRWSPITCCEKL